MSEAEAETEPIELDQLDFREKQRSRSVTLRGDMVELVDDLVDFINEHRPEKLGDVDRAQAIESVVRYFLNKGRSKDMKLFREWLEETEKD